MTVFTMTFVWNDPSSGVVSNEKESFEAPTAQQAEESIRKIWGQDLVTNLKFVHEAIR